MSNEIITNQVDFQGGHPTKNTGGYIARPYSSGPHPAVILVHEIWGLDEHIRDVSGRLAKEGYVTLAVDLFDGKTAAAPNFDEGGKLRESLDQDRVMNDLGGALEFLSELDYVDGKKIGCMGFCMGGSISLRFACHSRDLAAAIIFYGKNPEPLELVKEIRCPILGNWAANDQVFKVEEVEKLKLKLTEYNKVFDIKIFPGADHAFFNNTGRNYQPEAAKESWKRTVDFFSLHLK